MFCSVAKCTALTETVLFVLILWPRHHCSAAGEPLRRCAVEVAVHGFEHTFLMTLSTVSTSRSLCRLSFRMYQGASTIPRSTLFRNLCIMCLLIRMAVFILLVNQRGGIFARSYVKGVVMKCPEMICVVAENDVLESWKLVLKILPQNYQLCSVTCIFWLTKNSSIRIPWQYIVHNTTVWSITRQFSVYSKPSTGLCPVRNYHKPWWWLGISRNLSDFFVVLCMTVLSRNG